MVDLPSGPVTLLFTDIEGSTRHVQELGDRYEQVLAEHREILRTALRTHGGIEIDCRADELFACFLKPEAALAAAVAAQRSLLAKRSPVRVRMGVHTGSPTPTNGAYVGLDVNRAARICSAGHGGQILISATTEELLPGSVHTRDLGSYRLRGVVEPERIFEVRSPDLACGFLPLRAEPAEQAGPRSWRKTKRATPGDAAWSVREAIEPGPLQQPLTDLAAALFAADRELHRADVLLDRIDRRRLEQQLATQRQASRSTEQAAARADAIVAKLATLDRLAEERQALDGVGSDAIDLLDRSPTADAVTRLRDRIDTATTALADATDAAARRHDPLSYRLSRTRWRGVYRLEGLFVVPYEDHLGIDRQREFADARHARQFRYALKIARDGKGPWESFDSRADKIHPFGDG